jgi:hypothetical protein
VLLLLRGGGAGKHQEGCDVVCIACQFGEVFVHRVVPGDAIKFYVGVVIGIEVRAPGRIPPQGVLAHGKTFQELPRCSHMYLGQIALDGWRTEVVFEPRQIDV